MGLRAGVAILKGVQDYASSLKRLIVGPLFRAEPHRSTVRCIIQLHDGLFQVNASLLLGL